MEQQPVAAVVKLIRVALAAGADEVDITFSGNSPGTAGSLRIDDNGPGIPAARCGNGALASGSGLARAFGGPVEWRTVADDAGGRFETRLTMYPDRADPVLHQVAPTRAATGTTVLAAECVPELARLDTVAARRHVAREFIRPLLSRSGARINYGGHRIAPELLVAHFDRVEAGPATLEVVEWSRQFPGELVLCGGSGSALPGRGLPMGVPGFSFTAYLSWAGFEAAGGSRADLGESVVEAARARLWAYFEGRRRQRFREAFGLAPLAARGRRAERSTPAFAT